MRMRLWRLFFLEGFFDPQDTAGVLRWLRFFASLRMTTLKVVSALP
jgi:hypothetical protein